MVRLDQHLDGKPINKNLKKRAKNLWSNLKSHVDETYCDSSMADSLKKPVFPSMDNMI
jgi:hypothetical protein